jgi:hypothetical protein
MSARGDKKNITVSATELLNEISQIALPEHVGLAPYQVTPYDGYVHFMKLVKLQFSASAIQQLCGGTDADSIDQLLTPTYVFMLAMRRLCRILDCEAL